MRVIALYLYLFCFCNLYAQESSSIKQWLTDRNSVLETAFDQSIRNKKFSPAWVEKLELRTETDEFVLQRQEYTLRLTPSTPGLRKAQKNLIGLNNQKAALYISELRTDLVKFLLDDFLELYSLTKQKVLKGELQLILEDQQKVANLMMQDPGFNPKKLLEIEEELHKLTIGSYEDDLELKNLLGEQNAPLFSELIDIKDIPAQVSSLILGKIALTQDEKYQIDQAAIDAEIKLEKAEKNRILDYVQARYRGPHENILNERLSIGFGIELPVSGSIKAKLEQLQVEKWKLEQEAKVQAQLAEIEVEKLGEEIQRLIKIWKFSSRMLEENLDQFRKLEENSRESEWKSPEFILYKNAQQLERKLDLLSLESDILEKYLDLLQQIGLTSDDGYIDYLLK